MCTLHSSSFSSYLQRSTTFLSCEFLPPISLGIKCQRTLITLPFIELTFFSQAVFFSIHLLFCVRASTATSKTKLVSSQLFSSPNTQIIYLVETATKKKHKNTFFFSIILYSFCADNSSIIIVDCKHTKPLSFLSNVQTLSPPKKNKLQQRRRLPSRTAQSKERK